MTIDERNRMELRADAESGKQQAADRIAALEAELAAANERCAELAAANQLAKDEFGELAAEYTGDAALGHFGELARQMRNPSAILAAVREEARREGKIEALKKICFLARYDSISTTPGDESGALVPVPVIRRQIAALEVKG